MKLFFGYLFLCIICVAPGAILSQTIGGNAVFNFLDLPSAARISSLGGINISSQDPDISLAYGNPALLRDSMHAQVAIDFNMMYASIKNYFTCAGYHDKKLNTNFALAVNYIDYGSASLTDPSGNILGSFSASDYSIQLFAAGKYEKNWYYGGSVKFINSTYGQFKSNALALDVGLNFLDNSHSWQFGLVAKNMGTQLKSYTLLKEDLPFDVEFGASKKLAKLPLQISVTVHHIHQFDIRYADTLYQSTSSAGFADKIFRHCIFAAQYYIGNKIELTVGYNYLRRSELKISNGGNGWNGYSFGIAALFSKLQLRYARAYYQNNTAYNQLGINFNLKRSNL